jgi:hypothetical protein
MWVEAREREKNKEKHVNGAMFLTNVARIKAKGNQKTYSQYPVAGIGSGGSVRAGKHSVRPVARH